MRHCWITAPVDGVSPRPGLLVAWRRDGDTWLGRVLYVAELRAGQWAVVDEWLPSACLTGPDQGRSTAASAASGVAG